MLYVRISILQQKYLFFLLLTNPTIKRARLNFKFKRSASAQVSQASVFKSLSSDELLKNYVWSYTAEIGKTLGLGLNIQGPVSSGLVLENCSYTSLGLGLDHQEFPSLNLGLEINQQLSSANGTEFQKLLHN